VRQAARNAGYVGAVDDFDNGWDARAVLVDGKWVERTPRRPEVEAPLRREATLLPWLAPLVPLPIPKPTVVRDSPLRLRHRLIEGDPCDGRRPAHGHAIGDFLRALHSVSVSDATQQGVAPWDPADVWPRFQGEVLSAVVAVDPCLRTTAQGLLDRCANAPRNTLVHADLGPGHIRVNGDTITGIIDWMDACIGDPGLDLAWVLHGTSAEFADGVAASYDVGPQLRRRALDWHALGPWHQVTFGWDIGDDATAADGLSGVVSRLRMLTSSRQAPVGP
jgi:aminoglycoside phosphotransferase (APT) family kinase protein